MSTASRGGWVGSRRRAALAGAIDRLFASRSKRFRTSVGGELQPLEPRQLFTTLVGGDTFEYTAPDPANPTTRIRNRIVLTGNVVAELVGGSIDPNTNAVIVSDVPGTFTASDIGRGGQDFLGGPGGGSGIRPVVSTGTTGVSIVSNPPFSNNGNIPWNPATNPGFNTRATANDAAGNLYLFNIIRSGAVGTAGETALIQLVRVSRSTTTGQLDGTTGTVVAELNSVISGAAGSNFANVNGVEAITAAAYNPVDGNIYFVVRGNDRGAIAATGTLPAINGVPTQQLFRLSTGNPTGPVTAFQGSFNRTTLNDTAVTALAFDQVGSTATLYGYILDNFNNAGRGRIFQVNTAPAGTTNTLITPVVVRTSTTTTASLTAITGLTFVRDNTGSAETTIYAVESLAGAGAAGANVTGVTPAVVNTAVGPQVLSISLSSGLVTQLGSLPTPGQQGQTQIGGRGTNLQSLTFIANVRDPFTSQLGASVAIDNSTAELVFVDTRNRFPNTAAFALYISQSDANSSIVVGQVANPDPQNPNTPRPMQPFTGSAGVLRVNSAAGDGVINLTGPTGVGGVFLGLKTSGNQNADLNNIPIVVGALATSLGVRPSGTVNSGIVSSQSLMRALTNQTSLAQRLLGSNVSDVESIVVTYRSNASTGVAGSIIAIDSDGINANGSPITNDQLVTIDRTTGRATSVRSITNSVTGLAVSNGRGMTIDDNERILAIFMQQFADLQTNTSGGSTLPGAYPDFSTNGQQAISLSISGAGPSGYILAQSSTQKFLYSFTNTSGALRFTSLGPIVDADNATIAAANDLGFSAGKLYTVGFSRGNPVPTQSTGGVGVNLSSIDARSLTYATDGQIYLLSRSGQGLQIIRVNRDLGSGAVTNITGTNSPLTVPVVISLNGSAVQAVNDLTADPVTAGNLLGIGSTSGSLVPSTSVGTLTQRDGTSDFIYRGLTRLNTSDVYAVTFNGSTLDLRKTTLVGTPLATTQFSFNTVPGTPRSQTDGSPGTDIRYDANPASGRGATTAVLGVTATARRPGDTTNLYAVGYSADALIPTQPVLGDLGTTNVQQLAMSAFSPAYNFPDTTYTFPTAIGTNYSPTSAPYQVLRYRTAVRDTATSGLLASGGASITMQVVGQGASAPTSVVVPGGPLGLETVLQGLGNVVNGIVDVRALAVARLGGAGGYYTSGFNIDSPLPAAPIPGNLGSNFGVDALTNETNLRGLAIGDPVPSGQLQDMYATLFNTTGNDVYRITRDPVTGGISSFTKVNAGSSLRDPRNPDNSTNVITQIYTLWKDPNTTGRFFFIGSPAPTATSSPMTLFALDIVNGVAVVNNTDQPPRDITFGTGGGPVTGVVFKAGAISSDGTMYVVNHSIIGAAPNVRGANFTSFMSTIDRTTGALTALGRVSIKVFGDSIVAPGAAVSTTDTNIRAMQFHIDTDGRERLVMLDQFGDGNGRLAEVFFGATPVKASPQFGILGSWPDPAIVPTVQGYQSSLNGMVDGQLNTFTMDQYGRGFSIRRGANPADNDRIWTSPNELYLQASGDADGDNWIGENVRIGWLTNPDGTAFTDSVKTWTGDPSQSRLVAVVRNDLISSNHPSDPLFGLDRLVSLQVPGGLAGATVVSNGGGAGSDARITVTTVFRPNVAANPADLTNRGVITINSDGTNAGAVANITGLGFDVEGGLIGLDKTSTGGGRLVGLRLDRTTDPTVPFTGNPTLGTYTVTDVGATPFISVATGQTADPRGIATDPLGRFYSVDGGTITAGQPSRLLVSANTVSLFSIDTATAIATKVVDLADNAQIQQTPILSRFGGIAFDPSNSNLVYLVQKDLRAAPIAFDATGSVVGLDRLVSLNLAGATGTVAFTRYNNANTAGTIRVGNTSAPPNPPQGTATDIRAIDFTSNGQLIGLDSGPLGSNRLVRIELDTSSGLAPTNSVYATDPNTVTGFAGLSALGTQLASISTGGTPDQLLLSNNGLSLFSIAAGTGAATLRNPVIDSNNVALSDDRPVTALATQPTVSPSGVVSLTGSIYAVFRGTDAATGSPADILYSINSVTGIATLVGQIRITADQNGNAITPVNTNIIALDFSGERDAQGRYALMAVNDPAGPNNRQLIRLDLVTNSQGGVLFTNAALVPGSDPGEFSDNYLGFVSDIIDADSTRLPTIDRGRFFTLDTTVLSSTQLNVTPTRLYVYNTQSTVSGTNVAQFQTVGDLVAPNSVLAPSGGAVLDTIRSIDFNPANNQLYLARQDNSTTPASTLLTIPNTSGFTGIPASTVPQNNPKLNLSLVGSIQVASASTVALTGQPLPGLGATNVPVVASDIFFLADGTLRSVAVLRGENLRRLVDIPVGNPAQSVVRTNPGVPSSNLIAFDQFTDAGNINRIYAIDVTNPNSPLITVPSTDGSFGSVPTTSTQTGSASGVLGSPTIGVIGLNPADTNSATFSPLNTGSSNSPGRLPSSITDVKALAYDRIVNRTRTSQGLFIVDQNNNLVRLNLDAAGTTLLSTTTIGVVRDSISQAPINVGSMTFDPDGRLLVQDLDNGRVVDVSTVTAVAGAVTATSAGTLPSTVGAITYDPIGNRFLAVDNVTGINTTAGAGVSSVVNQIPFTLTPAGQDIDKILVGGTVAGRVSLSGSVGTFYAGWLITGRATGIFNTISNPDPANFYVDGDLGQLLTTGPVGSGAVPADITTNTYRTGTDILVKGHIGVARGLADSYASYRALGQTVNSTASTSQTEIENRLTIQGTTEEQRIGFAFENGNVINAGFNNDTFASAQPLYADPVTGIASVTGTIEAFTSAGDFVDYYSFPALGGQTVYISVDGPTPVTWGLFDPDGRLVTTNNADVTRNSNFKVTLDRPGLYRVAVTRDGDINFDGTLTTPFETQPLLFDTTYPYTLDVFGLNNLTVSAVQFTGTFVDPSPPSSSVSTFNLSAVYTAAGDIGSLRAARILGFSNTGTNTVRADGGNILSVDADTIGELRNGFYVRGMSMSAGGNVGLIRSAGILILNDAVQQLNSTLTSTTNPGGLANYNPDFTRVRGSIQKVQSGGQYIGYLFADKALGTLAVASSNAAGTPSYINVNADQTGADGTIDLIDVAGNLGTLADGGMVIYTNGGGNVRYMRVGGFYYRDRAFGGGNSPTITYTAGTPVTITDDSGAEVTIDFNTDLLTPNPNFDPNNSATTRYLNAPQIGIAAYPVRSGGAVIIGASVTGLSSSIDNPNNAPLLRITSRVPAGGTSNQGVEIGSLALTGTSGPVTIDANGTFSLSGSTSASPSYALSITGTAPVSIASLRVTGSINYITNSTGGELLGLSATSIGTLSTTGDLGIARAGGSGIAPIFTYTGGTATGGGNATGGIGNTYPFSLQENIIQPGNVIRVSAAGAIANVYATNIDRITANSDNKTDGRTYQGINGPVISTGIINTVNIGQGILPSGYGTVGGGMVLARGTIGTVTGTGDIRGMIGSQSDIGTVNINGAMINTSINVYTPVSGGSEWFSIAPLANVVVANVILKDSTNPAALINGVIYEAKTIRASQGMIGMLFNIEDINSLSADGFGIIDCDYIAAGTARISSVLAGGYGIRGSSIEPGDSIGTIRTRSLNGAPLSTADVTPSVRRSEFETIDSFFGTPVSSKTDIHAFLGTSAAVPLINGVTNTGVIEDLKVTGVGSLGEISAWQIRGSVPGTKNTIISVAQKVGTVRSVDPIDGLVIVTGRLVNFSPRSDINAVNITVSGPINNFIVNGSVGSNSQVSSIGPNAYVGNFNIKGNFDGSLSSSGRVGKVTIAGNLTNGTININPATGSRGLALSSLTVNGSISATSLNVVGNVGTISVAGSLGTAGDSLTLTGSLNALNVGTNRRLPSGKQLALAISVGGNIGSVNVNGRITGALTAAGSIRSIRVQSDGDSSTPLVAAPISSTAGDIGTVNLTGGDLGAPITAFNRINSITVSNGDITSDALIQTTASQIGSVTVKSGSIQGSIRSGTDAAPQAINSISATENLGDGTNALSIRAASLRSLRINASVLSRVNILISGTLDTLVVGQDFGDKSNTPTPTLQAAAIRSIRIGGKRDGEINIG